MKNPYRNDTQDNIENERSLTENSQRSNFRVNDPMMRDTDKDKVLVGIFETETEAMNVIRKLQGNGYQENEITVLAKDKEQMERIDETTNADTKTQSSSGKVGTGAAVGAVLGGVAALGLLVIPGIGPILAAGPIAVLLGGAVAGGVAGGLVGVLVQLGVNEADAKEYENYIEEGKILVLVENKDNLREYVQTTFRDNKSVIVDRSWQR